MSWSEFKNGIQQNELFIKASVGFKQQILDLLELKGLEYLDNNVARDKAKSEITRLMRTQTTHESMPVYYDNSSENTVEKIVYVNSNVDPDAALKAELLRERQEKEDAQRRAQEEQKAKEDALALADQERQDKEDAQRRAQEEHERAEQERKEKEEALLRAQAPAPLIVPKTKKPVKSKKPKRAFVPLAPVQNGYVALNGKEYHTEEEIIEAALNGELAPGEMDEFKKKKDSLPLIPDFKGSKLPGEEEEEEEKDEEDPLSVIAKGVYKQTKEEKEEEEERKKYLAKKIANKNEFSDDDDSSGTDYDSSSDEDDGSDVAKMKHDMRKLKDQLEQAEHYSQVLRHQNGNIVIQSEDYKHWVELYEKAKITIQELQLQIGNLLRAIRDIQQENVGLKDQNTALRTIIEELKGQLSDKDHQSEIDRLTRTVKVNGASEDEIKELQATLNRYIVDIKNLQNDIDSKVIQDDVKALQKIIKQIIDGINTRNVKLVRDNQAMKDRLAQLEAENARLRAQDIRNKDLEAEITRLRNIVVPNSMLECKGCKSLQEQIDRLQLELKTEQLDNRLLREKIRQLLDENEPINILAAFVEKKYGTLVAAINMITEDYENAVKYSNLNTETDDPSQLENKLPGRGKTTYSKVLTRMKELLREKGKSADIDQMEHLQDELSKSQQQFLQLKNQKDKLIRETNEKLQALQKEHKDAMGMIEGLLAENANLKTLNKRLSDQNVETKREMDQLLKEHEELTDKLIAARKSPKKAPESNQIRLRLEELTRAWEGSYQLLQNNIIAVIDPLIVKIHELSEKKLEGDFAKNLDDTILYTVELIHTACFVPYPFSATQEDLDARLLIISTYIRKMNALLGIDEDKFLVASTDDPLFAVVSLSKIRLSKDLLPYLRKYAMQYYSMKMIILENMIKLILEDEEPPAPENTSISNIRRNDTNIALHLNDSDLKSIIISIHPNELHAYYWLLYKNVIQAYKNLKNDVSTEYNRDSLFETFPVAGIKARVVGGSTSTINFLVAFLILILIVLLLLLNLKSSWTSKKSYSKSLPLKHPQCHKQISYNSPDIIYEDQ